ncbi:hypothetical protein PAHAL_9G380400 [Panicum hallii]|uniref:Uncharacterized protein n=1 Tax=Panicum hallii TaxID=206008 RepID=A0A2T8I3X3_9POAL|nr:probable CCR4-associated factor 1 homolog 11 [Panicum hallii]PVH32356.1 hypothetical protein PAHAL_9G380400 [Panicum hallii]
MNPAGAFYSPGPPFAMAMPALPYAPAALHPTAVPIPAPAAFYPAAPMPALAAFYPGGVPMQAPLPRPFRVPVNAVWADNFDAVRRDMGYFAAHARCVAVKVHYPGVIHGAQDLGALTAEKRYTVLKANVDALKPLQVGLAVATDDGRFAAWEFNLSDFDPDADPHAVQSLLHLGRRGLNCLEHRLRGVPMEQLTRALRRSGLLSSRPGVSLVTHTGAYHLAYLMKVLNGGDPLPGDMAGFLGSVRRSLGEDVYDVARMAADCRDMPVGLEHIAGRLRLAPPLALHPLAGAGSVLALEAFITLRYHQFRGDVTRYKGVLHGLQTV